MLGVLAGLVLQSNADFAVSYIKPFGTIYLNLIKMIVVPVVLLSITQGIVLLQDIKKAGFIDVRTVAFYLCTTVLAVTVSLIFANVLQVIVIALFVDFGIILAGEKGKLVADVVDSFAKWFSASWT